MKKQIGTCEGKKVFYVNGVVWVENTHIAIFGCQGEADAINSAQRNLVNFKVAVR